MDISQVTNGHRRTLNVCYQTKEANLKVLPDYDHIIPIIEHSKRGRIIKKVRKSVVSRYLGAWSRERQISGMGLGYSGRTSFDSVLSYPVNQCLVLPIYQNHRVNKVENLCEKLDSRQQRGLGIRCLMHKHEALSSESQNPCKNQHPMSPVCHPRTERWRQQDP